MRAINIFAIAAVSVLVLSGCTVSDSNSPETSEVVSTETAAVETQPSSPDRTKVEWEDYDSSVKTNIDALEAAKDCAGLQSQFDIADANGDATYKRTGHNNAKLMGYIDEALQAAGCY